jgi:hypothetical protein
MKMIIALVLLTLALVGPSMVPDDRQPLCPAVSTLVLRDAPAICLQAGVQARMEQLQRRLQRLRQQMERLVPQS